MTVPEDIDRIAAASNTGPILSAFQCAGVKLLKRYVARIYVAPTQLAEFEKHGVGDDTQALVAEGFVVVASGLNKAEKDRARILASRIAAQPTSGDPDPTSHLPEAEMLVIATRPELRCKIVLLDEKAARTVAEEIGLRVTGFPGILARAGLDGLLTKNDIRQMLKRCQQRGTHYSDALIEHVAETYGR